MIDMPTPLRPIERMHWKWADGHDGDVPAYSESIIVAVEQCPRRIIKNQYGGFARFAADTRSGQPCTFGVEVRRTVDFNHDGTTTEGEWRLHCGYCEPLFDAADEQDVP